MLPEEPDKILYCTKNVICYLHGRPAAAGGQLYPRIPGWRPGGVRSARCCHTAESFGI
jgi:hypothetical protein